MDVELRGCAYENWTGVIQTGFAFGDVTFFDYNREESLRKVLLFFS
jgi:hypothetical protein